jgi:predicted GNAT family N-acyltransferase
MPAIEAMRSNAPEVSVRVARSFDELVQAYVIRALVFVGEQACPYAEEFDGNDAVATHLVAYIGEEPVGAIRIRWFAEFSKLEHAAVLGPYRKVGVLRHLTERAVEIAVRKGYRLMYGTSQSERLPVWLSLGFTVVDKPRFSFSDYDYIPVARVLEPSGSPVLHTSSDLVIIRPEGDWDRPGVLDRSVERRGPDSKVA